MSAAQIILASYAVATAPAPVSQAWDTATATALMALSGGGLIVTRSGSSGSYQAVRALNQVVGKKYWELAITGEGGYTPPFVISGVLTASAPVNDGVGASGGWGYHSRDGDRYSNGVQTIAGLPHCSAGDVIMFAADSGSGNLWIGKNGTWFQGGDPVAGTSPQFTTSGAIYPVTSMYFTGTQITARFSSGFSYSLPAGFSAF